MAEEMKKMLTLDQYSLLLEHAAVGQGHKMAEDYARDAREYPDTAFKLYVLDRIAQELGVRVG